MLLKCLKKGFGQVFYIIKIKNKEIIMDNHASEDKYEFLKGRKVGSLVAVPLYKANKTYGLILAEHSLDNYFLLAVQIYLKQYLCKLLWQLKMHNYMSRWKT